MHWNDCQLLAPVPAWDIVPLLGSGCDNAYCLPSWCPLWLNLTDTYALNSLQYLTCGPEKSLNFLMGDSRSTFTFNPDFSLYSAAGYPASSFLGAQNGALRARGIFIDHISSLLFHELGIEIVPGL